MSMINNKSIQSSLFVTQSSIPQMNAAKNAGINARAPLRVAPQARHFKPQAVMNIN